MIKKITAQDFVILCRVFIIFLPVFIKCNIKRESFSL